MSCQEVNIDVQTTEITCLEIRSRDECTILQPQRIKTLELITRGPQGPPGTEFSLSETPSGAINGSNVNFTTANPFVDIAVYLNGLRLTSGAGNDYTVTGSTSFTMAYPPQSGDALAVEYTT
jgi:hypothetical protein